MAAEFPKWGGGANGLKKYLNGLDAYFNDHFGLRKFLIRCYRSATTVVFQDKNIQSSVVVGRDGWLYFNENQMIEHYRGTLLFTPEELMDWKKLLEGYRGWAWERGIKFMFVVAPDKQSIYPEHLPTWLNKISPDTKLDQFIRFMQTNSIVHVVDLRPQLLAAKTNTALFYQTDSHWNLLGSFLAYQKLMEELRARHFPSLRPISLDSFARTNTVTQPGDLAPMTTGDLMESNAVAFKPLPPLTALEAVSRPNIPGAPAVTTNPNAVGAAFVYGDSFINGIIPFLGYNFHEAFYFKNGFLADKFFDKGLIEQAHPDIVIIEVVERWFNVATPGKLLADETSK